MYPLRDQGGLLAVDVSGNSRHGVVTAGVGTQSTVYPSWVDGYKAKGGTNFDGFTPSGGNEGGEIRCPGNSVNYIPQAAGTISAWVRPLGTGPTSAVPGSLQGIFTLSADTNSGNGLFRGKLSAGATDSIHAWHHDAGIGDSCVAALIGFTESESGWIHVLWAYDGTNVYGGANGVLINSVASTSTAYLAGTPVKIGKGNANNFNGDICDVRTWDRVLDADELYSLFAEPEDIYQPKQLYFFFQNLLPVLPRWLHSKDAVGERHTDVGSDACEIAKARLLEQFKSKPKIGHYICAFADRIQEIIQALADVQAFRSVETAEGMQLDRLGENLILFRNGFSDDKYRKFLLAKTKVIASHGRPDELSEILTYLDDGFAPTEISYTNSFPAAAILHCQVESGAQLDGEAYAVLLKSAIPAGVRLILEFEEQDEILFQWAESDDDPAPDAGSEWEELDTPGVGGLWAEAV